MMRFVGRLVQEGIFFFIAFVMREATLDSSTLPKAQPSPILLLLHLVIFEILLEHILDTVHPWLVIDDFLRRGVSYPISRLPLLQIWRQSSVDTSTSARLSCWDLSFFFYFLVEGVLGSLELPPHINPEILPHVQVVIFGWMHKALVIILLLNVLHGVRR